ncbi:MAG: hypothetical protein IJV93_09860 [Lentisphaeria bacterium]|nr:hypothetical protein [Lentisphaeria bacterium]
MAEKTIFCPHCNEELALDEEYLGMEVECPVCQKAFVAQQKINTVPEESAPPQAQSVLQKEISRNDAAGALGKLKNVAGIMKNKAEAAASAVNSQLDSIQAQENEVDELEADQQIERIKKGVPVRKVYFFSIGAGIACSVILCLICGIFHRFDYEPTAGFLFIAIVFFVFFIVAIIILENLKDKVNKKTSIEKEYSPIERKRKKLAAFFSNVRAANSLANAVENLASAGNEITEAVGKGAASLIRSNATTNAVIDDIYTIFDQVRTRDIEHLDSLDILPRFGKDNSQLAAESHTLYTPLISEGGKYIFNKNGEFIYSKEEVTKIFTFEDQLLVFTALWDYTTGELYNEQTEAFFLKDITDISTENKYDRVKTVNWITPPPPRVKPFPVKIYCIIFGVFLSLLIPAAILLFFTSREVPVTLEVTCGVGLLIVLLWAFIHDTGNLKKISPIKVETVKRVRASETFSITSSSGRSIGMTILCDGWFEANNGKFEQRSDNEKIIHAIRKMIEEKKVAANE